MWTGGIFCQSMLAGVGDGVMGEVCKRAQAASCRMECEECGE